MKYKVTKKMQEDINKIRKEIGIKEEPIVDEYYKECDDIELLPRHNKQRGEKDER